MDAVLETRSLCKSFGALTVAQNIDFRLRPGEPHALIGPNGAGKPTFVNMLMGALRPSSGRILLGGDDVTRAPQAQRVKRGLGRTFQINSLFRNLPVLDNVALAVAERRRIALRMWRAAGSYKEIIEESTQLLATLGLADDLTTPIIDLPYGKQRLVEIAIALGLRPRVLLLDEPAAGVPSAEAERILQLLEKLPSEIAILIIEHDMDLVFRFARRITVLVQGEVLLEGTPQEVARDQRSRLGVGFVPQEREIFASLSVEENLGVAARPGRWTLERVYDLFPRLAERRSHQGNQISGGEQQMLAIGRALMGNPSLLLMDEPLEGLAPIIIESLLKALNRLITEDSLALVLVEQHAKVALGVTHHAMVLNRGRVAHYGPSEALLADPQRLSNLIVDLV